MSDPRWYSRMPRWARKVVDQTAHAAAGAAIAAAATGLARLGLRWRWAVVVGVVTAGAAAVGYELVQNLGDAENDVADAVLDAAVWTVAGVAGALALWGVRDGFRRKR